MPHLYHIAPILRFYIGFATVGVGVQLYNRKASWTTCIGVLSIFELKLEVLHSNIPILYTLGQVGSSQNYLANWASEIK